MKNKIVVDRNNLNNYKLKITTLSPVHIGTGEVYNPTNFIVDKNILHEFDEVLFYKSLTTQDKQKLDAKLDSWMDIIEFYKTKKEEAKIISHFECKSSDEVQKKYNTKINLNGTRNTNQLEINKTFKNPNTHRAIIPGSSLKGMLNTVLQIYHKNVKENDIRQNLIVADCLLLSGETEIGYMKRADRDQSQIIKKNSDISQIVEVIAKNSSFVTSISTNFSFEDIKNKLKDYHSQRIGSKYQETDNSFIARIGKFSGMDYVVDNIKDAVQPRKDKKPLGTHSLYLSNNQTEQFGWIKIEHITDDEYKKSLIEIANQEQKYFDDLKQKQKIVKDSIEKTKNEAKALKLKKEQEKLAQEQAQKEAEEKEKERLASLSPFDLKIDEIVKNYPDKNAYKSVMVYQAFENNQLDDFKFESLTVIKELMISEKIWDKPKKKSAYLRTQKIQKMLKENY